MAKKEKKKKKSGLTKTEQTKYRKMLIEKRKILAEDIKRMQEDTLGRSRRDQSGDLSNMPIHMADISSDNFELELTLGLIENEEKQIREIDLAIKRLEDGTFGICENCEDKIKKARLKAIPNAHLCIKCKKMEEEGLL
jgi:RNA polymerase-binding protein DksA